MKSFAELKRRIVVGTELRVTSYRYHQPARHLDQQIAGGRARKVGVVQTNAIAFENPARPGVRSAMSWLFWPKAADVKILGPNSFEVAKLGHIAITYEFA